MFDKVYDRLGVASLQGFSVLVMTFLYLPVLILIIFSFNDDRSLTLQLTGRDNTLPMYIWSTLRRGITPEINAVGTLIVISSLVLIIVSVRMLRDTNNR